MSTFQIVMVCGLGIFAIAVLLLAGFVCGIDWERHRQKATHIRRRP